MAYHFLDEVDYTDSNDGVWTDIDVSADVPAGAIGAMVLFVNESGTTSYDLGCRENGSTNTEVGKLWMDSQTYWIVGVDSNRIFEQYIGNRKVTTYLVGYFDSGGEWTIFTNPKAYTIDTSGSYVDIDITPDVISGTAKFAIWQITNTAAVDPTTSSNHCTFRRNGDINSAVSTISNGGITMISLDSGEICEHYNTLSHTLKLVGYAIGGTPTDYTSNIIIKDTWSEETIQHSGADTQIELVRQSAFDQIATWFRPNGNTTDNRHTTVEGGQGYQALPIDPDGSGDYEIYVQVGAPNISGVRYGTIEAVSGGETIEIDEVALDWSGKALAVDVTALVATKALDWEGQAVTAKIEVTEIPATVALDWVGQGMQANETITIDEKELDWAGQLVAADATVQVALVALDWAGQNVEAKIAILIDKAGLDWDGKTPLVNETVLTPKAALDWAGQTFKLNEKITVGQKALDWGGKEITASIATLINKMALDWAGQNVYEDEQLTLGATLLDYEGKTLTATVAVFVGTAEMDWSGQDVAANEIIEVGANPLDYEGQPVSADKAITVNELGMDWVGKSVSIPGVTIIVNIVALDWAGKNVILVGQFTRMIRIIGCGFKGIIGG